MPGVRVAPIRTPMVDDAGQLTPPWQRYFSDESSNGTGAGGGDGGGGLDAPGAPTAVALTVAESGETYTITDTWVPPSPIGTTSRYEAQFRFYMEAACTTPEAGWIGTTGVTGGDATTLTTDKWPKGGQRWVRTRVRGLNSDDAYSAWVESPAGTGKLITAATGVPVQPPQPVAGDWSVGAITLGADSNREYYVGVTLNYTGTFPVGATRIDFWFYRAPTRPSDPGLWQNCGSRSTPGPVTFYDPYPGAATTWVACCTASTESWFQFPQAATPTKPIPIGAPALAPAITDGAGVQETQVNDGTKQFRYKFTFTAPPTTDQNYHLTVLETAWVDVTTGNWVPGVSKWERVKDIVCYGATTDYLYGWYDCISPPAVAGRRRWRIRSINWNDEPSLASQPADITNSILTAVEPYATGIDLGYTNPGSITKGLGIYNGDLGATAVGLDNGDFALGLTGWSTWTNPFTIDPAGYQGNSAKATGNGTNQTLVYLNYAIIPGCSYRLVAWIKNTITGGQPTYWDVAPMSTTGAIEGGGGIIYLPVNNAWTKYEIIFTANPTSASFYCRFAVDPGSTGGAFWVDNVTIELLEVVGKGVVRGSDGSLNSTDAGLANGGFEDGFAGWLYAPPFNISTSGAYSGTRYAIAAATTGSTGVRLLQSFDIAPGQIWRTSCYAIGPPGVAILSIVFWNGGTPVSEPFTPINSAGWASYSIAGTVPTNCNKMWVGVCLMGVAGTIALDNFTLDLLEPASQNNTTGGAMRDSTGAIMTVPGDDVAYNQNFANKLEGWSNVGGTLPTWWATGGPPNNTASDGPYIAMTAAETLVNYYMFPIAMGEVYELSAWFISWGGNNGQTLLRVYLYKGDGTTFVGNYDLQFATVNSNVWVYKRTFITMATGGVFGRLVIATDVTAGNYAIAKPKCVKVEPVDDATLQRDAAANLIKIKDLGVLDTKLAAAAVLFAKIKDGEVSGVKIPTNGINSTNQLANFVISRDTLFLNAIIRDATIIDCYANKVTAGSFVGRDLTLAIGTYTGRIIGDADPTYGSVARVEVRLTASPSQRTILTAGGLACFQANNTKGFDVFVDTSASYAGGVGEFYRAGSAHGVTLDGRTGKVTATTYANGFKSDMLSHKIDGWQFPVDYETGTPAAGIVTLYQLAQRFNGLIVALLKQGIIG